MESCSEASCPHLSLPVEMDELMTSSSLNLAWPVCQQCLVHVDDITAPSNDIRVNDRQQSEYPDDGFALGLKVNGAELPVVAPAELGELDYTGKCHWNVPSEDEESLEQPLPLLSNVAEIQPRIARPGLKRSSPYAVDPQCPRYPPPPAHMLIPHIDQRHIQARLTALKPVVPMATAQNSTRARDTPDVMSEVCVHPSQPIKTGRVLTQEVRRTISLPEDCRTVFITYSVDVAEEIFPFVTFLINQGFRPAIDIFDNAVRQMDVNKWMDGYLKDKSVLIIMVISPKYKLDIEGDGSDQHGLHTKYIHSQLQNEFIQQRCLNFRLVPVLFPSANQSHVPLWLQSTRVFRWPRDVQDLLLRLLREERYIAPPLGRDLTLSIRPLGHTQAHQLNC
ncbi:E3 ubiquitin ligase TRAF3IP2 isoform X1 [Tachysurus fulvidraco]|uniref:E3 ubiquitin ligase TRAF3IP2 isoform X1 n=2 Tax=Tachysurus fulvidraco TaxID=1234273 RepID=UPI000F4EAD1E|nr:E3 ubiquitin ligase TRAF3IP2 isoform X1 [Tachysurus fulvidraco]XP_047673887.1 E3 ubiquitin ligase TRAF3IP2 isoform X1 [Tachysurus fulvidraco]